MTSPLTTAWPAGEPARSLRRSMREGAMHAVLLGAGEAYLVPLAIFLGGGSMVVGLIGALPLAAGGLAQLLAVRLLDRGLRRKPMAVTPALAQAAALAPILALPWAPPAAAPWLLVTCACAYHAAAGMVSPPWNSWMGDLVEPGIRGDYFGRRNRLRTVVQFVAFLAAGGALAAARASGAEGAGYAALCGVALLARAGSARELLAMHEPPWRPPSARETFSLAVFLRRSPGNNFGRFTLYVAALTGATTIAAPFFALYMLRDLHLSYLEFTAAGGTCILVQSLTYQRWGRVADRFGNRRVLAVTGAAIPLIPVLWTLSPRYGWILLVEGVSGLLWGGFSLAAANFLFDAVTPAKRARCVAYYNVVIGALSLAGALLGGWLAPRLPAEVALGALLWRPVSSLHLLFAISAAARAAVSLALLPVLREVREVPHASTWDVVGQIVGLFPIRGIRFSVFSGAHPLEREADEAADSAADAQPDAGPPAAATPTRSPAPRS